MRPLKRIRNHTRATYAILVRSSRVWKYKILSNCDNITGIPSRLQPVLMVGKGKIIFGKNVQFGFAPSPLYYDGICYLEVRNENSQIVFGNNVIANNGFKVICEKSSIRIDDNTLIGVNVEIIDSDFHEINPNKRNSGKHKAASVHIEENVFIGSNVKICKGVSIGKNSVIANSSVVFNSVPENSIVKGNPAKVISTINE